MALIVMSLPPMWDAYIEFWAPGFGLAEPWLFLWVFGIVNQQMGVFSVSVSLPLKYIKI